MTDTPCEKAIKMIKKYCEDCNATHPNGCIECGHCMVLVDWLPRFEKMQDTVKVSRDDWQFIISMASRQYVKFLESEMLTRTVSSERLREMDQSLAELRDAKVIEIEDCEVKK